MNKIQNALESYLHEEETILLADGFETAFIGIGRKFGIPSAIYDRKECIKILENDMTNEEAEEYFQFNVEGAWVGDNTPIFIEH